MTPSRRVHYVGEARLEGCAGRLYPRRVCAKSDDTVAHFKEFVRFSASSQNQRTDARRSDRGHRSLRDKHRCKENLRLLPNARLMQAPGESRRDYRALRKGVVRRRCCCWAAFSSTRRFTPERFIPRAVADALSRSIELGLKTFRDPSVETTAS